MKNLYNGNVEAVFEGEKNKVEHWMIELCNKGPSYARVDNVEVTWEKPEGYNPFEILYH